MLIAAITFICNVRGGPSPTDNGAPVLSKALEETSENMKSLQNSNRADLLDLIIHYSMCMNGRFIMYRGG